MLLVQKITRKLWNFVSMLYRKPHMKVVIPTTVPRDEKKVFSTSRSQYWRYHWMVGEENFSGRAFEVFKRIWSYNVVINCAILKNVLEKENFLGKNLWHIMSFCTRRSDGWPPISPVISKHAIFGVQSAWAAAYLADPVPIGTFKGRWALQNADSIYQVQNYLVLA